MSDHHVPRSTHHTVHAVAPADPEPVGPDPGPLWARILRMPLLWALVCGALAVPGYLAGDPGFLPFLFTLIGGWLCGLSFVNATLRVPAGRGLIVHITGAVGAGLLLWLMIEAVPALLAPKPNPARAFLAVLQLAAVPAACWVWLGLISRITAMIGARDAAKARPAPQWEPSERGSLVRFRAVPLSARALVLWCSLAGALAIAALVVVLIVTGGRALYVGPKLFLLLYIAIPGLPAYLVTSWLLRRRAVSCAVRFDADRLRIEVDGVEERIRYCHLDRLVWRADGDFARIEACGSGVDLTLVAGIARKTGGTATVLPALSRRAVRLMEEAGLTSRTLRGGRALAFERTTGAPTRVR
ncbi:hypothetical protein ACTJI8_14405 [Microbacterium sp. 22303]|uniref:hypothetical protein n=1 Tax=Microbacterium sp. 22303 TaxID=3453905 RepID=UPI003F866BB4